MKPRSFTPLAQAITDAMARLEALDALTPGLKMRLTQARSLVEAHTLLRQSRERQERMAALEAAIREQDAKLEKKK